MDLHLENVNTRLIVQPAIALVVPVLDLCFNLRYPLVYRLNREVRQ
ncbi:hypothetical protein [Nostoc sp. DSM 114160]